MLVFHSLFVFFWVFSLIFSLPKKKKLTFFFSHPTKPKIQAAAEAFAAENPETVTAFQLAASQKRALKKNGGGGGGAGASSSSSNGRRPSTALELFSADVAETVSAAAGGARGAELRKLVLEAWEGASSGSRAPYLSRATAEAAAFASSAVASFAAAGGGASKKRGRTKKRDADELEETEAYLADAARLKAMLTSSTTAAAAADSDDEDEEEREEGTDWGLAPPLAVLGLSPRRTHFLVARAGAPLFAYGLVSASLAARARAGDPQAMAECPLPPAMLDEFEESETAFARDLAARADGTGGYDLSEIAEALCFAGGGSFPSSSSRSEGAPIAATAAPPLDSFAFLGAMRHARAGLLGKPAPAEKGSSSKRLNRDVMVQVPALALSRLVRRIQVAAAVSFFPFLFPPFFKFPSRSSDFRQKEIESSLSFVFLFSFEFLLFDETLFKTTGRGKDGRCGSRGGREEGRGSRDSRDRGLRGEGEGVGGGGGDGGGGGCNGHREGRRRRRCCCRPCPRRRKGRRRGEVREREHALPSSVLRSKRK